MIHYLRELVARLRRLFGDRRPDQQLDNEIEAHLQLLTDRFVRQGMTEDEAAWAARRQFGNVTLLKEASREMRGIRFIETLVQDLRYGLWMMRRNPGFTVVAVLTLALGIGANTAIFSVVYAVIGRPLPYREPGQLVMAWERSTRERMAQPAMNAPGVFLAWRDRNDVFEDVAAYEDAAIHREAEFILTKGVEPERIGGARISGNLFSLLGVQPALGRSFTVEDEQAGRERVVILSAAFWLRHFAATPDIIGKPLHLNDKIYTIVGVMPPGFKLSYPKASELWIPFPLGPRERANWDEAACKIIARLRPGVTIEQARESISRLTRQLQAPHRKQTDDLYVQLDPLHRYHFGAMRRPLLLLLAAVAMVLLIACVNVASLSLAHAARREREIALRAAVGAGRVRLIRQLLTEALMLALIGGVAGLGLAFWGRDLLVGLIPKNVPRGGEVHIDLRVLGFTMLLSMLAGIASGLAPALQASRPDVYESLKASARSVTARSGVRLWRDALIIAESALSLILLIGAGLMIRSLWQLQHVDLGFNPKNVLTFGLTIPNYKFNPENKREMREFASIQEKALIDRIISRIKTLPGVMNASASASIPLRGRIYHGGIEIAGKADNVGYRSNFVGCNFSDQVLKFFISFAEVNDSGEPPYRNFRPLLNTIQTSDAVSPSVGDGE